MHQHRHATQNLTLAIWLNVFITLAEIIGGLLTGSLALISDAMHNLSDVVALVISLVAERLSGRKKTVRSTFGLKRSGILAAMFNSATLLVLSVFIFIEAGKKLFNPTEIDGIWVMVIAAATLIANGLSVLLLQKQSVGNLNIRSAYLHLFTDTLSSAAVLLAGMAIYFWHFYWLDSLLSFAIAAMLAYSGMGIFVKSIKILMNYTPAHINLESLKEHVESFPEIRSFHHAHCWQLNESDVYLEAHIDFNTNLNLEEANEVMKRISDSLNVNFKIQHTTLQPEYKYGDELKLIVEDL